MRKCKQSILHSYLDYTERHEAPTDFHLWSLITVVSYTLNRRVFLDYRRWQIYPNIYTVLVGESGATRKSTTQNMAVKLLKESFEPEKLNISSQKLTPSYLIKWLKKREKAMQKSDCLLYADEFKNLIGATVTMDDTIVGILMALFDSADEWSYGTIAHDEQKLKNIYTVLLAGSTEEWLHASVPDDAWDAGFFSRTILVPRHPRGIKVCRPHLMFPDSHEYIRENIIEDLRSIAKIQGPYVFDTEADEAFAAWYETYLPAEEAKAPRTIKSYYARKDTHVQKLAMIIAACSRNERIIYKRDLDTALMLLSKNEEYYEALLANVSMSKAGKMTRRVEQILEKEFSVNQEITGEPYCTHAALVKKTRSFLDTDQRNAIIKTLLEARVIEFAENKERTRPGSPAIRYYPHKEEEKGRKVVIR